MVHISLSFNHPHNAVVPCFKLADTIINHVTFKPWICQLELSLIILVL